LEDQGIIASYQANLDPAILGFTLMLFCEVTLTSQNDSDVRAFETTVNSWPLVRECYVITGGADFLLKILAQDFNAYQEFLSTELSKHPLVANIKTQMVIRTPKKQPGVPVELLAAA
jgi:DNA-binding Lrp family transcriptional regulator